MTGILTEKKFSLPAFLKGGGALVVGFSFSGAALAGRAKAATSPSSGATSPARPTRTRSTPGSRSTPTTPRPVYFGKVELGQGAPTGLLQIAAEELDLDFSQVKGVRHDTNVTPDQGNTAGSNSIQGGGPQVRNAAAERAGRSSISPRPSSAYPPRRSASPRASSPAAASRRPTAS